MLPRHRAWRWLLWLSAAVFLLGVLRYAGAQLDDSFISFRYARNLVEGHGLVFNPGERVEGYTNLLFVLLSAVFIGVGIDPLAGAGLVTFSSALAALAVTALLVREVMEAAGADLDASRRAAVTAMSLLLTAEGFAYWSVAGMETTLFAALLALAVLQLLREERQHRGHASAALFTLLALTRPEGVLAAAVALGAALVLARLRLDGAGAGPGPAVADSPTPVRAGQGHLRQEAPAAGVTGAGARPDVTGRPAASREGTAPGRSVAGTPASGGLRTMRRLAVTAGLTAAGMAALFLWRLGYYGSLLPNTFPAKVTGGAGQTATGWRYLGEWILSSPVAALSLAAPLILLSRPARRRLGRASPLWILHALVAAFAASAVGLGGDSMPFHRFMIHVQPLAAVVVVIAAERLLGARPRPARAAAAVAVTAIAVNAAASHATVQPYRVFVAHRTAVVGSRVGEWLGATLPEGSLLAVNTIGAIPWTSRLPTLDMLGLTDPVIARRPVYVDSPGWAGHRRGWGSYVMSRRPAAILWYNSAGSPRPFYLGDRELADNPWFRFFYRHRIQRLPARGAGGGNSGPVPDRSGTSEPRGRVGEDSAGHAEERAPGGPGAAGSSGEAPVIARFLGRPFGFDASGSLEAPELGVTASYHEGLVPWTEFREGPVAVHWFEPDPRDKGLWALRDRANMRVGDFVEAVAEIWRGEQARWPAPGPEIEEERRRVEELCEEARLRVEEGDLEAARRILSRAAAANARARSPRVYRYMANLAVMTGEIFVALAAQKEALRRAPASRLHAENLKRLLTLPWEEATTPRRESGSIPGE